MNDTLKAVGNLGAELGAAKAENERLRGLLRECLGSAVLPSFTEERVNAALSQQAEPAPAQDEREAFERDVNLFGVGFLVDGIRVSPDRVVMQYSTGRPAQTGQPVAVNPDPPEMIIRWYESPESVHRAMWEPMAIGEGMTYDELLAEGVTCGFDESGNEVEMEAGADIEGMRMQGCWAFVDTLNSCIHAWAAPDADRGKILHMLAHEIGHATGTPHPDGFQEEMRAEQFGRVAAAAYSMLLDKDRPQCTAPACGCADAYCMAWPDEAAPIAQTAPQPEQSGLVEALDWLDTEVSAIDTWYRGSPSYERDAGWFKSEVLRLIEGCRAALSTQGDPDAPDTTSHR
ncbi:hypothetical protein [Stutzerimonas stutzeri]|uniref:Uncharacterized protein n=1 Tax=Stutzerimonas stutzeri KOS6 TaxID=1218352 RepID=A0A061JN41_STUST|nr:hypothetical protein [Stutzerimonas stutzeri]EWC39609.1 hypothetical protein B597_019655 [Stutzerimonas stutzeri KOS6]